MKLIQQCLIIFILFFADFAFGETAVNEAIKFKNATDNLLNSNEIAGLKKLSEVADVCAANGNAYAAVFAAGLKFGVSQLDEDKAAAYEKLQNTVDTVQQRVHKLGRMLPWELLKMDYSLKISRPLSRLILDYNTSLAYVDRQKGAKYFKERCIEHRPLGVLQDLDYNTQCSAFSVQKYTKIRTFVDNIEKTISFSNISKFALSSYKAEKQKFILTLLRHNNTDQLLKKQQHAFDQLSKISFNHFMEIMINIDAIYGDEVQACWTDIVYVGVDHSRVKLERFIQMVEIDSLTALNYVTLCADIVHDGDFGAVTSDFTNAKKFIDSLTLNIEKYYNSSLEKSYPEIFKTCIKETIGNSEIDKLEFNKTAKNLMEKLNRRGLEKYDYHVIVTDLITNGIESEFRCRAFFDCFDITQSNLRVFVIRYESGIHVNRDLYNNEIYWAQNKEMFITKLKEAPISDELLPYTDVTLNVFFQRETLHHFSVLILHNKKWHLGRTDVFYGYDFSRYKGESMMQSIDRFDRQLSMDNHDIKIMFIY